MCVRHDHQLTVAKPLCCMHNTSGPSTAEFVWELCNAVIGPKTGRLLVYTMLKFGELAFLVCTRDISVCMRDEKTNMRR